MGSEFKKYVVGVYQLEYHVSHHGNGYFVLLALCGTLTVITEDLLEDKFPYVFNDTEKKRSTCVLGGVKNTIVFRR